MADVKISNLPASTVPLAGTEVLPIVQSSSTKKVSVANLTAGRDVSANIFSSAAGTAALPAITTTGDTNTGVFFPAADTIGFAEGGVEAMRIDSSGNVIIGATSPAGKFYVNGSSRLGNLDLNLTTANAAIWITGTDFGIGTYYGNAFKLLTDNIERMRITGAGNVGIGATPNTSALLDVQSTTKGVRMPNMTTAQKNLIASPAAGLMVFDTTLSKLCVYSGAAWETITSV